MGRLADIAPAPSDETEGAGALTPAQATRRRRRFSMLTRRDKVVLALMVGIPLILDLAFIWGPTLASVVLSFTDWQAIGTPQFVGLKEYQTLLNYEPFVPALEHNLLWLLFFVFIATPAGILLAVLLDREVRGSRFYQTIFYIPVVLSLAVVGLIWEYGIYASQGGGLIDSFLEAIGAINPNAPIDWLGNPSLNIWAVLVAASWRHIGYIMVLYLAGLKSVDPALREAAAIDGATERQTFLHVVFPVLAPINVVIVVVTIIESLRAFDIAYVINHGKNGLELLSTLIVNNSISEASLVGFGSAIAVVLLLISVGPIVLYLSRVMRSEDNG